MSHVDVRSGGRTPGRRGSALASVLVLALLSLVTTVGVSGGSQAEAANAPVAQLWCSGWGSDVRVSTVRADSYVDVHVHGFPPRSSVVLALDSLALPARLQTDASGSGLTSLHLSVTKFGAQSLVATAGASRAVVEITVLPPIRAWDDSTASAPSVAQATQVAAPASPVPAAPKARLISPPRAPRSVSAATAPRRVASSGDPVEGALGATDSTPPSALPGDSACLDDDGWPRSRRPAPRACGRARRGGRHLPVGTPWFGVDVGREWGCLRVVSDAGAFARAHGGDD